MGCHRYGSSMHGRARSPSRWLRAVVCGSAGVGLGLVLHVMASGSIHSVGGVAAALGLSIVLSASVLEHEASALRIWSLLALAQLFTHMFAGTHGAAAHAAHDAAVSSAQPFSGQMLVAHLAATVVLALWLRDLERVTWRLLLRAVGRVLGRGRPRPIAAPPSWLSGPPRWQSLRLPSSLDLLTATTRRGPPTPVGIA